jgi:predicted ATPase
MGMRNQLRRQLLRNPVTTVHLDFSDLRVHGREIERETLLELKQRIRKADAPAEICFVHGVAGSGKTSICEELHDKGENFGYFISSKPDQDQSYSVILQALENLGQAIIRKDINVQDVRDLRQILIFQARVLIKLIPSFAKLISDEVVSEDDSPSTFDLPSMASAFLFFLRNFCSPSRPLVLFIDDLQSADRSSLNLLADLVNDTEMSNVLVLGAYRDEAAPELQPFLDKFRSSVTYINIGNLDLPCLNSLVADITCRDPEDTLELSQVVRRRTMGNPFYVVQFLELLNVRLKLLKFDFSTLKWEWDLEQIASDTNVSDNVADLLAHQVKSLPRGIHRVLKLAACIGTHVGIDLLENMNKLQVCGEQDGEDLLDTNRLQEPGERSSERERSDIADHTPVSCFRRTLESAVNEGLIELTDSFCKFTHGKIQHCVYELIPSGAYRKQLHYQIGKFICGTLKLEKKPGVRDLFLAVDQLNKGSSCINDNAERLALVRMNLEASNAAKTSSGVEVVADFLQKAVALITEFDWESTDYELVLEVYSRSADAESTRGHFAESNGLVETILKRARAPKDKIEALAAKVNTLTMQRRYLEVIYETRKAMTLIGEPIPNVIGINIHREFHKTRRLLKGLSNDELVSLPRMTDSRIVAASKLLTRAAENRWRAENKFMWLIAIQRMKITLKYGLTDEAVSGFASFGVLLARMGYETEAFRLKQLALQVDTSKRVQPARSVLVDGFLSHLCLPVSVSLAPLLSAFRMGLDTGEILSGGIAISFYSSLYILCGLALSPFADDMRKFARQLQLFRHDLALIPVMMNLRLAENLSGQSDDPVSISWEAICRDDLLIGVKGLPPLFEVGRLYLQVFNAYILGDLDRAEQALKQLLSRSPKDRRYPNSHFINYFFVFVDGIVSAALCRRKRRRRYQRLLDNAIKWLVTVSKKGCVNCLGMLRFLEAERKSSLSSDKNVDRELYAQAISLLARGGFNHFCGIASERMGECMLRANDMYWAKHYLNCAAKSYQEWGAKLKVAQLKTMYDFVNLRHANSRWSGLIHGRCKFSPRKHSFRDRSSLRDVLSNVRNLDISE